MNFLASPPLVVAYALAGSLDVNLMTRFRWAQEPDGEPGVPEATSGRAQKEDPRTRSAVNIDSEMFKSSYESVFAGDANWNNLAGRLPARTTPGTPASTYVKHPPYFEGMTLSVPEPVENNFEGARVLALLGDSVTTDHISPAGSIAADSPGRRLPEGDQGVKPRRLQFIRLPPRQS